VLRLRPVCAAAGHHAGQFTQSPLDRAVMSSSLGCAARPGELSARTASTACQLGQLRGGDDAGAPELARPGQAAADILGPHALVEWIGVIEARHALVDRTGETPAPHMASIVRL
jgi:hypothetical protein